MTRETLLNFAGRDLGVSPWRVLEQVQIDAFAALSGDHAPLHVDPVAAALGPFGGPVAHGMLLLSVLTGMAFQTLPKVAGAQGAVSMGFERVAFLLPVRAGEQVRGRFRAEKITPRGRADVMLRLDCSLELEGQGRPAVTALWDMLYRF